MAIKICHMTSAHNSNDSRIFQRECVSIAEDDTFEVYLIAPGDSYKAKNVNIIGVGDKPRGRLKRMLNLSKLILKKATQIDADVYHFHDPELLWVGNRLKKQGKIVIFDSHESTVDQIKIKPYLPIFTRNLVSKIYDKYETIICRKLDAVIFPCLVDNRNPFEKKNSKTVFVNNLPFLSEFTANETFKKKFDVCVVGSLTESRGITYLLRACKKAKVKVALGGDFDTEEYKKFLENEGLLNADFVDYFGFCDRSLVKKIYAQSKLCVSNILAVGQYPKAGNLPTKVYECMAMRMPIIISNFGYPLQLNNEYNFAICVNPYDVDEIAGAIKKLLSDENTYKLLGENGRSAIEEEFNWEKESKKLIKLYKELCGLYE